MSEQTKQDPIEEGLAMSTQLIEPQSNVTTERQDQQLQELKLYVEGMVQYPELGTLNVYENKLQKIRSCKDPMRIF